MLVGFSYYKQPGSFPDFVYSFHKNHPGGWIWKVTILASFYFGTGTALLRLWFAFGSPLVRLSYASSRSECIGKAYQIGRRYFVYYNVFSQCYLPSSTDTQIQVLPGIFDRDYCCSFC